MRRRKSTEDADNESVPDWPESRRCEKCDAEVWVVSDGGGEDVTIDTLPMATQLIRERCGMQSRIRARGYYRFDESRREGGWRLLDPQPVTACVEDGVVEGGWDDADHTHTHEEQVYEWFAEPVPLTAENGEPLYSEHRLTCSATTEKFLDAMLPDFAGDVWEEVPDSVGTQAKKRITKALRVKRLVEARRELVLPWKLFKPLDLLDDVTTSRGQLGLWWTPEMAKPKRELAVQEVSLSQLSLFRGGGGE